MKEMVISVCIVSIATAIFRMLVPESSFKKQISFLVACFFAVSLLSIFTKGDFEVDFDVENSIENSSEFLDISKKVNDKAYQTIGKKLSDEVRELLSQNGIIAKQILINVNIPNLYSISISEVRLVFNNADSDEATKAVEIVQKAVGDEIKVTAIQ